MVVVNYPVNHSDEVLAYPHDKSAGRKFRGIQVNPASASPAHRRSPQKTMIFHVPLEPIFPHLNPAVRVGAGKIPQISVNFCVISTHGDSQGPDYAVAHPLSAKLAGSTPPPIVKDERNFFNFH